VRRIGIRATPIDGYVDPRSLDFDIQGFPEVLGDYAKGIWTVSDSYIEKLDQDAFSTRDE